jgi:hypothetical protein
MIGGWELKIDLAKMKAITKWSFPTIVTKVMIFVGASQYLWGFITYFLVVFAPLHAITTIGKSFQC